jgi:hypothetical protein
MVSNPEVIEELERITKANGGVLKAEDVVDTARSKKSPLHEYFDWEDGEAAQKWRLHQARQLIRVTVRVITPAKPPVRVFVSLRADREDDGGGYRFLTAVLSDSERRNQLLTDALAELKTFEVKYRELVELADVFVSIQKTRRKLMDAAD